MSEEAQRVWESLHGSLCQCGRLGEPHSDQHSLLRLGFIQGYRAALARPAPDYSGTEWPTLSELAGSIEEGLEEARLYPMGGRDEDLVTEAAEALDELRRRFDIHKPDSETPG